MGKEDEKGAAVVERPLFCAGDLKGIRLRREWVEFADGKWVCCWEPTGAQMAGAARVSINSAAQWDQSKFELELMVDCVRDGEGDNAQPVFNRARDWKELETLPNAIQKRVANLITKLGGAQTVDGEKALRDFFGKTPTEESEGQ